MALGPIPVSKIEQRGERLGFTGVVLRIFVEIELACDDAYRGWQKEQYDSTNRKLNLPRAKKASHGRAVVRRYGR